MNESINKSCFLAPIHIDKFEYGYNLVKTYNDLFNDCNIYLVFSNQEYFDTFNKIYNDKNIKYRSIIYTDEYDPFLKGIITLKKWFGLNYIYKNTDNQNVAVIDVDYLFIKKVDYNLLFHQYLNNKKIHANFIKDESSNYIKNIIISCVKFFKESDQKTLSHLTHNFKLYFWFNNICIYNKELYLKFLEYINYEKIKHEISWFDFDYIVYCYYLLVTNKIELKVIKHSSLNSSFIEDQNNIDQELFTKLFVEYNPMWIKTEIQESDMENVFIKLHVDRN